MTYPPEAAVGFRWGLMHTRDTLLQQPPAVLSRAALRSHNEPRRTADVKCHRINTLIELLCSLASHVPEYLPHGSPRIPQEAASEAISQGKTR